MQAESDLLRVRLARRSRGERDGDFVCRVFPRPAEEKHICNMTHGAHAATLSPVLTISFASISNQRVDSNTEMKELTRLMHRLESTSIERI